MTATIQAAADNSGWSLQGLDADELAELEKEYAALGTVDEGHNDMATLTAQLASASMLSDEMSKGTADSDAKIAHQHLDMPVAPSNEPNQRSDRANKVTAATPVL